MEFKFNVNDIFQQPIVEISNNLIPPGFSGDRRALWDTLGKVSEIINAMGEASATAQGLSKPITTAERLRNSEHKLYFLVDQAANNGKGAVIGMLKVGSKGLYVFDREGQHYQVTPPCILDFYVHESRQRTGLGKQLFEHMLQKEEVEPVKMAIDRPSEKLLGFLNKHYNLNSPVKQMNNYVVFDGFFPKSAEQTNVAEARPSSALGRKESANGLQKFTSPQGRYGAPRPPCSMGEIIHNQTTNNKTREPTGVKSLPATNYQGIQHGGPHLATQSTPNINVGQRILNNAYSQNLESLIPSNTNRIQMDHTQASYNPKNFQHNAASVNYNQISTPNRYNYQQYDGNQQRCIGQNQNLSQSQIQYNTGQNVFNDQNTVNGNLHNSNQTNYSTLNAQGDQNNLLMNSKSGNQSYLPQPIQCHNMENAYQTILATPQNMSNHPNITGSQDNINNPCHINQCQNQQRIVPPSQYYANVNQQFKNLNLNNSMSLSNTGGNNISSTEIASNLQSRNINMSSGPQNTHQAQTMIQPIEPNLRTTSNIDPNANWNQSNLLNAPQGSHYTDTSSNNYMQNFRSKSSDQYPQHPFVGNESQVPPQSIQNMARPQEIPPNIPQQNVMIPHLNPNQNVPPSIPAGYQDNVTKLPVTTLPQSTQVNYNNMNQLPSHPYQISQSQISQRHDSSNVHVPNVTSHISSQSVMNHPFNPEVTGQQIYQNVAAQQPPYTVASTPVMYNQAYGNQNQNISCPQEQKNQYIDKPYPQDPSLIQTTRPAYSERNLTNVPNQISRHNMVESSSVPNMMNNFAQKNNECVPNVSGDNTQLGNTYDYRGQEVNQNISQGDMKTMYEEESLPYGYPPQFVNDVQDDVEKPHISSKLERPRSLSIQKSEDDAGETAPVDKDCKNLDSNTELTDIQNNLKEVQINEGAISENLPPPEADDSSSTKTPSHLTNQGYFDIKFYHNKLW